MHFRHPMHPGFAGPRDCGGNAFERRFGGRHDSRGFDADGEVFARHCAGRRGPRGFDADDDGGSPWGGRHRGGGRFGRVFGHGDLKLVLLALVAEQPRHGYQLIRTIEEMFDGAYSPSPGTVYPTLTLLEEMGHARVETQDGDTRKLYHITPEGSAWLEENRDAVEAVMARLQVTANAMSRMAAPNAIREAMHTLRHALSLHGPQWTADEARRVRAIIEKAAAEIAKGDGAG